jgi:hypothetical protein
MKEQQARYVRVDKRTLKSCITLLDGANDALRKERVQLSLNIISSVQDELIRALAFGVEGGEFKDE